MKNQTEEENKILRRLLWQHHGCESISAALYGDDGELQCNVCGIDFKRDTAEKIEERFGQICLKKIMTRLSL